MLKLPHDEYLKQSLKIKQMQLESLVIEHRIFIAKQEIHKEILRKEIDSISRQLEK